MIRTEAYMGYVCLGIILYMSFGSLVGQDVTLPYSEDFETGTTGDPGVLPTDWSNVSEGTTDFCSGGGASYTRCYDWAVWSGGTNSSNTGPSSNHTSGGTKYVFVEASGNGNPRVYLHSPTFDLDGSSSGDLTFWAHNYSSNSGMSRNLYIDILTASGTVLGNNILTVPTSFSINAWREWSVSLAPYANSGEIRIRFEWDDGSDDWRPDVAIDDVSITGSLSEICDNGSDDDSDGLVDCLDSDCDANINCDNDGDLIADRVDQDDDNDGILDALECYSPSNLIANSGFESGNSGFSSDFSYVTCTTDCGPGRDLNRGDYAIDDNACGCGGQSGGVQEWTGAPIEGSSFMILDFNNSGTDDLWRQTISTVAYKEYSFTAWVRNINFSNETDPRIQLAVSTNGGTSYTVLGTSSSITEAQGWKQIGFTYINGNNTTLTIAIQNANSGNNGRDIAIDALSFIETNCDDDSDGVKNMFDLDSDNDGLYDVFESASGQAQSGGILTGGVDSDGIPNSVSDGSGYIDYLPADSDGDGLLDAIELDSDDDGCYDAFEEQITDPENDGIAGIGTPSVDGDGLVTTITYTTPAFDVWQDPGEDNPGCDGDTDDDGIPDEVDLDDDNDGILDTDESISTIDFSGTQTHLSGTGTLADLDEGDIVLYDDAILGCQNIQYDITVTIVEKSPGILVSTNSNGIDIGNAFPNQNDYVTFKLNVVESGSATDGLPTGTSASVPNFTLSMRDIDSDNGNNYTEVVGYNNVGGPDNSYLDFPTLLELGGFLGGGPSGSWTTYRQAPQSGVNNWTSNGNISSSSIAPEIEMFMEFADFSEVTLVFGLTGARTTLPSISVRATRFGASSECDRDMDGVPNRVDLDSDNDGIFDLYEAGHSFTADTNNDGIIDGADSGSGANGYFNSLETSTDNGNPNYSLDDSDSDSNFDFLESDSDADNCFDVREVGISDGDEDGIVGIGSPPVNAYGVVTSITYEAPPTTNWQDPIASCLEICDNGLDDDGDGDIDGLDTDCANYYLEAECGFPGANWVRTFDIGASNNDFQTIMTGLNSTATAPTASADILRFTVNITAAGTYRILGRVKSNSGADDSFWFSVNGGTWYSWNDWDTGGTWEWREFSDNDDGNNPVRYALTPGAHTIDIAYREDGAGLDKLHLTINGNTPAGEGEEAINCQRSITTNLFLQYKIRNRNN